MTESEWVFSREDHVEDEVSLQLGENDYDVCPHGAIPSPDQFEGE